MPRYHPFVGNINPISQREGNLLYWLKDACRWISGFENFSPEQGDP